MYSNKLQGKQNCKSLSHPLNSVSATDPIEGKTLLLFRPDSRILHEKQLLPSAHGNTDKEGIHKCSPACLKREWIRWSGTRLYEPRFRHLVNTPQVPVLETPATRKDRESHWDSHYKQCSSSTTGHLSWSSTELNGINVVLNHTSFFFFFNSVWLCCTYIKMWIKRKHQSRNQLILKSSNHKPIDFKAL